MAIGVILNPIPNGGPNVLYRSSSGVIEVRLQGITGGDVIEGDLATDDDFVGMEIDVDAAIVDPWPRSIAPTGEIGAFDGFFYLIA